MGWVDDCEQRFKVEENKLGGRPHPLRPYVCETLASIYLTEGKYRKSMLYADEELTSKIFLFQRFFPHESQREEQGLSRTTNDADTGAGTGAAPTTVEDAFEEEFIRTFPACSRSSVDPVN